MSGSALVSVLIVAHRPDRPDIEPQILDVSTSSRPFGELARLVVRYLEHAGPVEAVLVTARRPAFTGGSSGKRRRARIEARGVWLDWNVIGWAGNEPASERSVPMDPPDLCADPGVCLDV